MLYLKMLKIKNGQRNTTNLHEKNVQDISVGKQTLCLLSFVYIRLTKESAFILHIISEIMRCCFHIKEKLKKNLLHIFYHMWHVIIKQYFYS